VISVIHVGCKVNLCLEITGVRPDGYHELETLFFPVPEPHDTLTLRLADGESGAEGSAPADEGGPARAGLALTCSDKALASPANLVAQAYETFASATGWRPALAAHLEKGIPSGAGLGGGSADAAALLGWLNARAGARALSPEALNALAARLGADVPFFLMNHPAWAEGAGERLTPADCDLSGLTMLVCAPPVHVNTAWAYREWDRLHAGSSAPLTRLAPASMRPFCVSGAFFANSFESAVFPAFPAVRALKERLLALGAAGAGMSGSGSAVFGIFRDSARADAAANALSGEASVHATRL
jgi:4-diphosphocytidyl-2-C-methyl-D-erythritol kinase